MRAAIGHRMSHNAFTNLSLDSLANVTGGTLCKLPNCGKSLAQNGGTGYVDHSLGFGNVIEGGRWNYAAPNGFGGRTAEAHGSTVKVRDPAGQLPI